jgi:hypothetical protein
VLVERGTSTVEPPSVEPRLQWPGPVKQPQQPSEAADATSGQRDRSRPGNMRLLAFASTRIELCRGVLEVRRLRLVWTAVAGLFDETVRR